MVRLSLAPMQIPFLRFRLCRHELQLVQHLSLKQRYAADVSTRMELLWVDLLRSRLHLADPLYFCELGDYFGHGWAIIGVLRPAPLYDIPELVR